MTRQLLALAATLALTTFMEAQASDLRGRVVDAATGRGIENLQVKLTPPRQSRAPIRLARTARDGTFTVAQIVSGRYLIEISQGVTLLYRAEVSAASATRLEIPLRRKDG
jgi:hypothetical protein